MKKTKQLLHYIQTFFQDYLSAQRGLSSNTVFAYRDTIKLFLTFAAQYLKKHTTRLTLDNFNVKIVLAFLDNIEKTRKIKVVTRNLRLAALRTFFAYLATQDTLRVGQYQKIIAIPLKQAVHRSMEYLEVNEVKAILDTINQTTLLGRRDYALLSLLYNTGARVQEICDLRVKDLRLESPSLVVLTGKGQKTRYVPLWTETTNLLQNYLVEREINDKSQAILFLNAKGDSLSRFGIRHIVQRRVIAAGKKCSTLLHKKISPHTFRHTTAMHLLQSGVDLTVIKSWLGHANISTTHDYIEIDLNMKRKALSACAPMGSSQKIQKVIKQNEDLISWLETL